MNKVAIRFESEIPFYLFGSFEIAKLVEAAVEIPEHQICCSPLLSSRQETLLHPLSHLECLPDFWLNNLHIFCLHHQEEKISSSQAGDWNKKETHNKNLIYVF